MNLLKVFLDLCLFQAKPQDLRFSYGLAIGTGLASLVSYVLVLQAIESTIFKFLGKSVSVVFLATAETLVFAGTVWVVFRLRMKTERFVQSISAVFGATTAAQLLMWPVSGWLQKTQGTPEAQMPNLILLGIRIWLLVLLVSIFKESLEVKTGAAFLITVGCWVVAALITVPLVLVAG